MPKGSALGNVFHDRTTVGMGACRVPSRTFVGCTSLDGALPAAVFAFPLCCGVGDVFFRPHVRVSDRMREALPWSAYRVFVTIGCLPCLHPHPAWTRYMPVSDAFLFVCFLVVLFFLCV